MGKGEGKEKSEKGKEERNQKEKGKGARKRERGRTGTQQRGGMEEPQERKKGRCLVALHFQKCNVMVQGYHHSLWPSIHLVSNRQLAQVLEHMAIEACNQELCWITTTVKLQQLEKPISMKCWGCLVQVIVYSY